MIFFENKNRNRMGIAPLNKILEGIKEGRRYNCTITLPRTHRFHSFKMKDVLTQDMVEAIRTDNFSKLPLQNGYYLELTDNQPLVHFLNNKSTLEPPALTTQDAKDALPGIVFSVESYNGGLKKYKPLSSIEEIKTLSGYICIDIDKLPAEDLVQYKHELFYMFDYVKAIFVSPSGKGLKMIIKYADKSGFLSDSEIRQDIYMWKDVYHELNMNLFSEICQMTSINCDPNAIDMNRLCYMSFDPEILIRDDNEVMPFQFRSINTGKRVVQTTKEYKKEVKKERASMVIPEIKEGDSAKFVNDVMFFIDYMKKNNKRPFQDSDYDSVIFFVFGMVDASHVFNLTKEMTYNLVYEVITTDPYYGNHKGEGESFIRNRFENAWNNYNPNRTDRRTYMTVSRLMSKILQV